MTELTQYYKFKRNHIHAGLRSNARVTRQTAAPGNRAEMRSAIQRLGSTINPCRAGARLTTTSSIPSSSAAFGIASVRVRHLDRSASLILHLFHERYRDRGPAHWPNSLPSSADSPAYRLPNEACYPCASVRSFLFICWFIVSDFPYRAFKANAKKKV